MFSTLLQTNFLPEVNSELLLPKLGYWYNLSFLNWLFFPILLRYTFWPLFYVKTNVSVSYFLLSGAGWRVSVSLADTCRYPWSWFIPLGIFRLLPLSCFCSCFVFGQLFDCYLRCFLKTKNK